MKNKMKTAKSNKKGKVLKTIMMVIGAGALAVYFSKERNRSKSQEKALELGNYLLGKMNDEKRILSSKAKDLIKRTKASGKEIDNILSEYNN
ncbi:hypothetical protein [Aquiflexum lacus]|uniref:hypothetical protein n=1 Tax=Aquiflexum lacus TaxID=2483805 RepID=UPI0018963AE8|nr:hypothetical protein [Aquiflexum lacus]